MRFHKHTITGSMLLGLLVAVSQAHAADPWVVHDGYDGPGKGKHVVIVTGDDEYRSEESMPQLAKILAKRQGFKVTVLFAIDPDTQALDPSVLNNIPGLEALETADLMILFLRFRELPDDQMKRIIDYTNSGRPIIGIRTATHAFSYQKNMQSPYAKWTWTSKDPKGGWGRAVLGETWVNHYGHHGVESTRGVPAKGMANHPILRGCEDIWGESDVYGIRTLSGDSKPLVMGQVLVGMKPSDEVNTEKPSVPIAWLKTYTGTEGIPARIFTTTMGHSYEMKNEGFRRMLVNAVYWGLGMENVIPPRNNVDLVGDYNPSNIGFGTHKKGVMPADHEM